MSGGKLSLVIIGSALGGAVLMAVGSLVAILFAIGDDEMMLEQAGRDR